MIYAFMIGILSQSSLLLSGLTVYWVKVPEKIVGWIAGFGAGALISAISFDLFNRRNEAELGIFEGGIWLLIGALLFIGGDYIIDKRIGHDTTGSALGIILGAVVDGIPESVILGLQVASGGSLGSAFLFAVWISNVPQALAPSSELASRGWHIGRMALVWGGVVVFCGIASGVGYLMFNMSNDVNSARMAALAAGGLLAMLTDSLIPFAYQRGGVIAGLATVVGFAVAFVL